MVEIKHSCRVFHNCYTSYRFNVCVPYCVKLFTYISLTFVKLKINNPSKIGDACGPFEFFWITYKRRNSDFILVSTHAFQIIVTRVVAKLFFCLYSIEYSDVK